MDPISIVSVVVSTTSSCLSTAKKLYDLREKYRDAPVIVVSICSESNVISASLTQIQMLLLRRQSMTDLPAELPVVLDQAVTGCMVVFSCLELEIQRITSASSGISEGTRRLPWRARARVIWNESKLSELLCALRGQQAAINLLIQLLQMKTLEEIKDMLQQEQTTVQMSARVTQSLRTQNPSIKVANSIYSGESVQAAAGQEIDVFSTVAPSDMEFDFDDAVVNSQAYRRALAQAQAQAKAQTQTQTQAAATDQSFQVPPPAKVNSNPAHNSDHVRSQSLEASDILDRTHISQIDEEERERETEMAFRKRLGPWPSSDIPDLWVTSDDGGVWSQSQYGPGNAQHPIHNPKRGNEDSENIDQEKRALSPLPLPLGGESGPPRKASPSDVLYDYGDPLPSHLADYDWPELVLPVQTWQ